MNYKSLFLSAKKDLFFLGSKVEELAKDWRPLIHHLGSYLRIRSLVFWSKPDPVFEKKIGYQIRVSESQIRRFSSYEYLDSQHLNGSDPAP